MATAPANDREPLSPCVVGEIISLHPDAIDPDPNGRIGQYFPVKAEGLACRIAVDGQIEPIIIAKAGPRAKLEWRLVAGRHRLEACRSLDRVVIARVVRGSADELHRIQASENIDRRELTALERSMFVAAVAEAAQRRLKDRHGDVSPQALGGITKAARRNIHPADAADADIEVAARAAMDNLSIAYGWKAETAAACGLGEKDVQRALRIYRGVVEPHRELIDALKDHPIAGNANALLQLARLTETRRREALEWLVANPSATTLDEAMVGIGLRESAELSRSEKQAEAAINIMVRMGAPEKLALFQSPRFQDQLPAEVRRLLAPIRRDGKEAGGE